jgi:signal transduction histidine kinase
VVTTAVQEFLAEPAVADPPPRNRRDLILLGAIVVSAIVETALRSNLRLPLIELVVCLGLAPAVLWRRIHPLATTTAAAFGAVNALSLLGAAVDKAPLGLYTTAIVLLFPYALFRWGSGRHAATGTMVMVSAWAIGTITDPGTVGDAIGGFIVPLLPALFGLMVRYRGVARDRAAEEIRLREREELARELHDTAAHHVSAIAVQAQAAQAIAPSRPEAAIEILAVIEEAASRTLTEMRTMVGALRQSDDAELAPQQGVADLQRLAQAASDGLLVEVHCSGQLASLEPIVDRAVYRITQESVTNAVRHGRGATRVDVQVIGLEDCVQVTVRNDGAPQPSYPTGSGPGSDGGSGSNLRYGLMGMSERAKLLGGSFSAGPVADGGWQVSVVLPRSMTVS